MNSKYEIIRQIIENPEKERMEQRKYILELERKLKDLQHNDDWHERAGKQRVT